MKVYSWNMYFNNADIDRAFDFISKLDFDVLCLQEVPTHFVDRLRTLSVPMDVAVEMDQVYAGTASTRHLVILSRYPIVRRQHIALPYRERMLKWRAYLFVRLMVLLRLWGLGVGNRHSQFVDITMGGNVVRVFNIHLPLATTHWRAEELETALIHRDRTMPTIVCGDFNILEHPIIAPLAWFLGDTVRDAARFRQERLRIQKRFVEHELTNLLRGKRTHALSRSQLDHILVSHHFSIVDADVLPDAVGSDHQPIFAEVKK